MSCTWLWLVTQAVLAIYQNLALCVVFLSLPTVLIHKYTLPMWTNQKDRFVIIWDWLRALLAGLLEELLLRLYQEPSQTLMNEIALARELAWAAGKENELRASNQKLWLPRSCYFSTSHGTNIETFKAFFSQIYTQFLIYCLQLIQYKKIKPEYILIFYEKSLL